MVLTNHLNLQKESMHVFIKLLLRRKHRRSTARTQESSPAVYMPGQGTRNSIRSIKNQSWRPTAPTQESSYSCATVTDRPGEGKEEGGAYQMVKWGGWARETEKRQRVAYSRTKTLVPRRRGMTSEAPRTPPRWPSLTSNFLGLGDLGEGLTSGDCGTRGRRWSCAMPEAVMNELNDWTNNCGDYWYTQQKVVIEIAKVLVFNHITNTLPGPITTHL